VQFDNYAQPLQVDNLPAFVVKRLVISGNYWNDCWQIWGTISRFIPKMVTRRG